LLCRAHFLTVNTVFSSNALKLDKNLVDAYEKYVKQYLGEDGLHAWRAISNVIHRLDIPEDKSAYEELCRSIKPFFEGKNPTEKEIEIFLVHIFESYVIPFLSHEDSKLRLIHSFFEHVRHGKIFPDT